jgi:uncharacterized protein YndB with AHSA1/START domain
MKAASHDPLGGPADRGCLVICDVSGYSTYLHSVELEHAQDVLADLTETIVEQLRPTFRLSKLEGDAAFVYALESEVEASMMLDTIEATYFAFRRRVRDIDHATACDCAACQLIPQLDLKVITHFGRFTRTEIAGHEELTGPDVILVHRLLKTSVRDRIDTEGFALHTEACLHALAVDPETLGFVEHRETYDDVGEIVCYLDDLNERWRYESARERAFVVAAEAEFEETVELPAPVPVVWEWVTNPQKRPLWEGATDRIDEEASGGRRGVGTTNHCVHGRGAIVQRILDWRPFRYFTMENEVPVIGPWRMTFEFEEVAGGSTRVRARAQRLHGLKRRAMWAIMRRRMAGESERDWERLREILERETVSAHV